jgi:hypothetical protein
MPTSNPYVDPDDDPIIPGWPAFRNRWGRSGLDPLDTYKEWGYLQGLFIRKLFTGRLRTRNPIWLGAMIVSGIFLVMPYFAGIYESLDNHSVSGLFVIAVPVGLPGYLLLLNVYYSLRKPWRRAKRGLTDR